MDGVEKIDRYLSGEKWEDDLPLYLVTFGHRYLNDIGILVNDVRTDRMYAKNEVGKNESVSDIKDRFKKKHILSIHQIVRYVQWTEWMHYIENGSDQDIQENHVALTTLIKIAEAKKAYFLEELLSRCDNSIYDMVERVPAGYSKLAIGKLHLLQLIGSQKYELIRIIREYAQDGVRVLHAEKLYFQHGGIYGSPLSFYINFKKITVKMSDISWLKRLSSKTFDSDDIVECLVKEHMRGRPYTVLNDHIDVVTPVSSSVCLKIPDEVKNVNSNGILLYIGIASGRWIYRADYIDSAINCKYLLLHRSLYATKIGVLTDEFPVRSSSDLVTIPLTKDWDQKSLKQRFNLEKVIPISEIPTYMESWKGYYDREKVTNAEHCAKWDWIDNTSRLCIVAKILKDSGIRKILLTELSNLPVLQLKEYGDYLQNQMGVIVDGRDNSYYVHLNVEKTRQLNDGHLYYKAVCDTNDIVFNDYNECEEKSIKLSHVKRIITD